MKVNACVYYIPEGEQGCAAMLAGQRVPGQLCDKLAAGGGGGKDVRTY